MRAVGPLGDRLMWVLIVKDQDQRREEVCESKAAAEKRRGELMKKGTFATVEFRREKTHEFDSGRTLRQQPKASVAPDRLRDLASKFRKS
jgi:hypothetical protein